MRTKLLLATGLLLACVVLAGASPEYVKWNDVSCDTNVAATTATAPTTDDGYKNGWPVGIFYDVTGATTATVKIVTLGTGAAMPARTIYEKQLTADGYYALGLAPVNAAGTTIAGTLGHEALINDKLRCYVYGATGASGTADVYLIYTLRP